MTWTKARDARLRAMWSTATPAEMLAHFGISKSALYRRAKKLGLAVQRWEPSIAQRMMADKVARAFGHDPSVNVSHGRHPQQARARFAGIWVIRQVWPSLSFPQTAVLFGNRDHSTIIYAYKRAEYLRERDEMFRKVTDALVAGYAPPPVPKFTLPGSKPRAPESTRNVRPRNDFEVDDFRTRRVVAGSTALLAALKRAHPERFASQEAS